MSKIIITPRQCKAARDLLGWTQGKFARRVRASPSIIANFERGNRELRMGTLESVIEIFEGEGIRFENNEHEYAVILLKNLDK